MCMVCVCLCVTVCMCVSSPLPCVLSPPQPLSTFPPLHIPLTETRSPSSFFSSLSPITLSLGLVPPSSFCYIDILSLPLYWDTPLLTAPPVTLSMTTDLRGKCKVPPHQEIKTLASSRCLTPLTSLVFPRPFLYIPLPKSPLYHSWSVFFFTTSLSTVFSLWILASSFTCLVFFKKLQS